MHARVSVRRERDHLHFGKPRLDLPRRLDAVEPRHRDVHHHDVGRQLGREFHRRATLLGLGDYFEAGLCLDQRPQPVPHYLMVVAEKNFNGHGAILRPTQVPVSRARRNFRRRRRMECLEDCGWVW
jgi:hypothetical protein